MQASSAGRVKVLRATQQAIKKRERGEKRREEKRREEKRERERHTQKQRGTLGVVSRIFFRRDKRVRDKERETKRERES